MDTPTRVALLERKKGQGIEGFEMNINNRIEELEKKGFTIMVAFINQATDTSAPMTACINYRKEE